MVSLHVDILSIICSTIMFRRLKFLTLILLIMTKITVMTEEIQVVCVTFCLIYSDGVRLGSYMFEDENRVNPRSFTVTDDSKVLAVMIMGFPPKLRAIAIESSPLKIYDTGTKWKCLPRVDVEGEWTNWKFDERKWKTAEVVRMIPKCQMPKSQLPCMDGMNNETVWISAPQNEIGVNDTKAILCRRDVSLKSYIAAVEGEKADKQFWTGLKIFVIVAEILIILTCIILFAVYRWRKSKESKESKE